MGCEKIDFHDNRFLMFILDELAYNLEKSGYDVIRLTLGKSEYPVHRDIIAAMQDALQDFNKSSMVFPAGLPELKECIANYYEKNYDYSVSANNIIISAGTSTIFRNLYQILLNSDDEVLLPIPYYSLYQFCAKLVGAKIRYYNIDLSSLKIDIESFKHNFTKRTKVVVLNTPGNPLGNIITKEELLELDNIINGQAIIINDEIYGNMCFDLDHTTVMNLNNTKSQFIITNAFSKGFGMYSRRIGYCIVPDEFVEPMTVIQHHTLLTVDPVVQYGAIEALNHIEEINNLKKTYKQYRDYAIIKFDSIRKNGVKSYYSQGGFYITIDCMDYMKKMNIESSEVLARKILEDVYVATVPGSDFGLPYTLRLSFSNLRFAEGIDRLVQFFS